jgi:hypothetical protein
MPNIPRKRDPPKASASASLKASMVLPNKKFKTTKGGALRSKTGYIQMRGEVFAEGDGMHMYAQKMNTVQCPYIVPIMDMLKVSETMKEEAGISQVCHRRNRENANGDALKCNNHPRSTEWPTFVSWSEFFDAGDNDEKWEAWGERMVKRFNEPDILSQFQYDIRFVVTSNDGYGHVGIATADELFIDEHVAAMVVEKMGLIVPSNRRNLSSTESMETLGKYFRDTKRGLTVVHKYLYDKFKMA